MVIHMPKANKWDNGKGLLLEECHSLAARYETNAAAREILYARARKISFSPGYTPDADGIAPPDSIQQTAANVLYALTMDGDPASGAMLGQAEQELSSLEDCGEKEYLLALLALRRGRSETQRLEALRHIREAQQYSNSDPRYLALVDILLQQND